MTNKPTLQTTKKLKSSSLLSAPVRDARERAKRFKSYLEHLVREVTREIMANIYNKWALLVWNRTIQSIILS